MASLRVESRRMMWRFESGNRRSPRGTSFCRVSLLPPSSSAHASGTTAPSGLPVPLVRQHQNSTASGDPAGGDLFQRPGESQQARRFHDLSLTDEDVHTRFCENTQDPGTVKVVLQ